jgi:hypothetical protein
LNAYQVTIGPRNAPRLSFEALSASSADCFDQHADLARPGDRIESVAIEQPCRSVLSACDLNQAGRQS